MKALVLQRIVDVQSQTHYGAYVLRILTSLRMAVCYSHRLRWAI